MQQNKSHIKEMSTSKIKIEYFRVRNQSPLRFRWNSAKGARGNLVFKRRITSRTRNPCTKAYRDFLRANPQVQVAPEIIEKGFVFNQQSGTFVKLNNKRDRRVKSRVKLKKKYQYLRIYNGRLINRHRVIPFEELEQAVEQSIANKAQGFSLRLRSANVEKLEIDKDQFKFHNFENFQDWFLRMMNAATPGSSQTVYSARENRVIKLGLKDAFSYMLFSNDDIEPLAGGLSTRKEQTKFLTTQYFDVELYSPASKGNNCGLEALRSLGMNFCNKSNIQIRRQFGLSKNEPIAPEVLKHKIYDEYIDEVDNKVLEIIDYGWCAWIEDDDSFEQFNYVMLHKNHYWQVKRLTHRGIYAEKIKVLKDSLATENDKDKRENLEEQLDQLKAQNKEMKLKKRRGVGAFDFETRPTDTTYHIGSSIARPLRDTIVKFAYRRVQKKNVCVEGFTTTRNKTSARQFLDWLVEEDRQNRHYTWIAHNGSNFDFYLLYKEMTESEIRHSPIQLRGTSIIGFQFFGHVFKDTYNFMPSSLDKLCKSFKISDENAKLTKFQFDGKELSNTEMCFYKPELAFDEFMALEQQEPNFWKLYEKYCENDSLALMELWEKFSHNINTLLNLMGGKNRDGNDGWLQGAGCTLNARNTIAGLGFKVLKCLTSKNKSLKRYFSFFKDEQKPIREKDKIVGYKTDREKYEFVCKFKRGGISHCHMPGTHHEQLFEIDQTSQYPCAMMKMKVPVGWSRWTTKWEPRNHGYYHLRNLRFNAKKTRRLKPICANPCNGESLNWAGKDINDCFVDCEMIKYLQAYYGLESFDVVRGLVSQKYATGRAIFGKYITPLFDAKKQQDYYKNNNDQRYNPALREVIKLFLNAVSGKLVEDPSKYWKVDWCETKIKAQKHKTSIGNTNFVMKKNNKCNLWVGLGVMMYSYSKRSLFEYIRMLPNDSDSVVHIETDGIWCQLRDLELFKENVENYKGNYPVAFGSELGQIKLEHITKAGVPSFFQGKKCYYAFSETENEEIMRVKGVPQLTIDEHGSTIQLVKREFYEKLASGSPVQVEFSSIRRSLFGNIQLASYTQTRTVKPCKGATKVYY